ncbi:MAG: hypothetical protein ACQERS_11660 [Bacteroidota bacterium]
MEDFGDILFYVIAAVIAIIGVIANKKKKQAEREMTQAGLPEEEEETDYSQRDEEISYPEAEARGATTQYEMIDQGSLETEGTGFEDTVFKGSEEQALKKRAEYEGSYSEPMAGEAASEETPITDVSISQFELGKESEFLLEKENSWAHELTDEFDLPSAIIYSEILKRKDFV